MTDNVNHPDHYTGGDVECIDAIRAALGAELFCGFLWGNAMKYLWRWARKDLEEDLEKCVWYIERMKAEGYAMPTRFDADAGCMMPNAVLSLVNCGIVAEDAEGIPGVHARFA